MYVYAFIQTPSQDMELPQGIVGKLEVVSWEGLAAVVEAEISPAKIEAIAKDDELLKHAYITHGLVTYQLFQIVTILPLKFYHCFADLASLKSHLQSHHQTYLQSLKRFENRGEYLIKLTPQDPPSASISTEAKGRDYFLAKKQVIQQQQDFKQQQADEQNLLIQQVEQAYPDVVIRENQICILTHRQSKFELQQTVENWQNICPTWELELSEAIPPYDFLSLEGTGF
ncbi:MAG: hypothetical protein F6K32_25785 [Desertifilum sp. SIO1I2]|nr:hypothetical protein [Desertifilum sp. SIO1I2]